MHDMFLQVAASPAGLEYQSYFALGDGSTFKVYVDGCNPKSSAAYQRLF